MDKRWQANRMGFVNFWLYDEEEFFFDKGRLLLRGENASGKSITTQSMIPFILDGDRSPERLDPFGSKDRKMEYYLLGDHEREDATGYIYLEFKKQDLDQYCTIGIGQRAQLGKPIAFWGFVILDNRRIGSDVHLYREFGSKRIPKTKQELKNDLGEQNILVDRQKDYMAAVNKHIFGFSRLELYEQFIRLLIKVRAPKLSKDLKPSMVYDILNESLQTLSDDDIRLLVDAMEQLDTIQETIDGLNSTMKDVNIVRVEYDRYNKYMLSNKALKYQQHHQSYVKACRTLETKQQEIQGKTQKQSQLQQQIQKDQDHITVLEQEKAVINAQDIDNAYQQLDMAKKERENNQAEKDRQEENLEAINNKLMDNQVNLSAVSDQIDSLRYEMTKSQSDIETSCAELGFSFTLQYRESEQHIMEQLKQANEKLAQWKKGIKTALEVLNDYEREDRYYGVLSEELSRISNEQGQIQNQLNQARQIIDTEKDRLIEMLYTQKHENQYFLWEEPTFLREQELMRTYQGLEQQEEIINIHRSVYDYHQKHFTKKKLQLEFTNHQCQNTVHALEQELADLKAIKEPVMVHKTKVDQARKLLQQKGVRYLPFYQTIEFIDHLSEQKKDLLEAQLSECGVLDALIVAEADMHLIKQEWDRISDVILTSSNTNTQAFPYLTIGNIDPVFTSQVKQILCSIGQKRTMNCDMILEDNGYYRHGLLEGHCIANESACFIGIETRVRKQRQLIMEKEQELADAYEQLAAIKQDLNNVDEALDILEQEYQRLPIFDDLNASLRVEQETSALLEHKQQLYMEKEAEVKQCAEKRSQLHQSVLNHCRAFPFERKVVRYEQALEDCDDLKEYYDTYRNHCFDVINKSEVKATYMGKAEDLEQSKANITDMLSVTIRNLRKAETTITQLEQYLNQPENKDIMQQLTRIETALKNCKENVEQNKNDLADLHAEQRVLYNDVDHLQDEIKHAKVIDEELLTIYEEEFQLGFVIRHENANAIDCLQEAIASMRAQDKTSSAHAITASLARNFQQHSSNLFSYGATLDNQFEDHPEYLRRRSVIHLEWNGQKLNLEQFYTVLKTSIDEYELMIQEKDRKIFEDILSGTVSQKLSNRIAESRKWIDAMSDMMWSMDTSMGLNFKLKWKAKTPESDQELSIEELEKLLIRDKELLTKEDMFKVSTHFRSKIQTAKYIAEEKGNLFNYGDLIRDALDYRNWFEFHMYYAHAGETVKELTNSAFNKFSGGEKAMAMYVPLFAAVNAQYKKCERAEHPRIIALDEAFAGVDDKNISVMFDLVEKLDFDYIMNSQALWGCYAEVSSLHIAELSRPVNSPIVTVINYHWNGQKREVI